MKDQANTDRDEADENILTSTVSDEALEAAAGSQSGAPTFFLPTGYFQCC
jgi:hypothetical protein